jgi:hypothetical protein
MEDQEGLRGKSRVESRQQSRKYLSTMMASSLVVVAPFHIAAKFFY